MENFGKLLFAKKYFEQIIFKTYPKNSDINDILIKVAALNDFYSTNIFSVFPAAKHILKSNIDERLQKSGESLVNDIARIKINGKEIIFYSFAKKYCSHHHPTEFPIYDAYVFDSFKLEDLKSYSRFKQILINFKKYYSLDKYNLKEIDKYLWQLGKDFFPKKY